MAMLMLHLMVICARRQEKGLGLKHQFELGGEMAGNNPIEQRW
jgi:hypothetical protein